MTKKPPAARPPGIKRLSTFHLRDKPDATIGEATTTSFLTYALLNALVFDFSQFEVQEFNKVVEYLADKLPNVHSMAQNRSMRAVQFGFHKKESILSLASEG